MSGAFWLPVQLFLTCYPDPKREAGRLRNCPLVSFSGMANQDLGPESGSLWPGRVCLFATHLAYWNGCGSKCKVWIKPWSHKRSRPLIQTCPRELIQNFDPHLWNDLMYGRVDVWSSGGCMFLGFLLLFTLPSSQATNCCKATLPSI